MRIFLLLITPLLLWAAFQVPKNEKYKQSSLCSLEDGVVRVKGVVTEIQKDHITLTNGDGCSLRVFVREPRELEIGKSYEVEGDTNSGMRKSVVIGETLLPTPLSIPTQKMTICIEGINSFIKRQNDLVLPVDSFSLIASYGVVAGIKEGCYDFHVNEGRILAYAYNSDVTMDKLGRELLSKQGLYNSLGRIR